jgi:His/Glu/Gln/Arg/opine family amino acid ABC transporter permease subunit
VSWDWLSLLLPGAIETLRLSVIASAASIAVALVVALGCLSQKRFVRRISFIYIELFRAIPLFVLLIVVYYGLGVQIEKWHVSAFMVAAVVIVVNEGAYTADVYRSALLSVERGQWHAGASIGLSPFQTLRYVVLPQFMRVALRPTVNMLIYVIKSSALASLITVDELSLESQRLVADTFQPLQVYGTAALLYLAITMPLGGFVYFMGERADKRLNASAKSSGPSATLNGFAS